MNSKKLTNKYRCRWLNTFFSFILDLSNENISMSEQVPSNETAISEQ